jgi:poly(hydroxyalkanoate) granule-associated protein
LFFGSLIHVSKNLQKRGEKMAPKIKPKQPDTEAETKRYRLFDLSRKVLLAAVGAVALAQDEIEEYVKRLVERGEIAEKDGRALMQEVFERRKNIRAKMKQKAGRHLNEAFAQMDLPTRQDMEKISKRVAELSKKVDEFKQD